MLIRRWVASAQRMSTARVHLKRTAGQFREERWLGASVEATSTLSPTVRGLRLRLLEGGGGDGFLGGQWVDVRIPGMSTIGGFSMTSAPFELEEEGVLSLAVKASPHPPAHWLHSTAVEGDRIRIRFGGNFHFDPVADPDSPLLLVAGGVGLNPLYSILMETRHADQRAYSQRPIRLLYSAATEDELLFKTELRSMEKTSSSLFHCSLFASRGTTHDPSVKRGRISSKDVSQSLDHMNSGSVRAFLCGPLELIQFAESALLSCGLSPAQIHYEKWT